MRGMVSKMCTLYTFVQTVIFFTSCFTQRRVGETSRVSATDDMDYKLFQVKTLYDQIDPANPALKRESAELYFKENVPPLIFSQAFEVGF